MRIIYIATVQPECYLQKMVNNNIEYVVAPQKFHSNLISGLLLNGCEVTVISQVHEELAFIPFIRENGVDYYFCARNKHTTITPLFVAKEVKRIINGIMKNNQKPDAILCDSLNVSLCMGTLLARRLLGIPVTAIVTDIMGISSHEKQSIKNSIASRISNGYLSYFDSYVFLTEQMNTYINKKSKPYIVMEGVCPEERYSCAKKHKTDRMKRLFYAGGRPSKDGVDFLIAAFKQIEGDYKLDIYGKMPGVKIGTDLEDERITYHGVVNNDVIVKEEYAATLLINPRPIDEEYTKYSFPSKIMEYMNTGTALVTTRLPGIPEEYYNYVYTFDNVSVSGFKATLLYLLNLNVDDLDQKGLNAQEFVRKEKNVIKQTRRIINLIKKS